MLELVKGFGTSVSYGIRSKIIIIFVLYAMVLLTSLEVNESHSRVESSFSNLIL